MILGRYLVSAAVIYVPLAAAWHLAHRIAQL